MPVSVKKGEEQTQQKNGRSARIAFGILLCLLKWMGKFENISYFWLIVRIGMQRARFKMMSSWLEAMNSEQYC